MSFSTWSGKPYVQYQYQLVKRLLFPFLVLLSLHFGNRFVYPYIILLEQSDKKDDGICSPLLGTRARILEIALAQYRARASGVSDDENGVDVHCSGEPFAVVHGK